MSIKEYNIDTDTVSIKNKELKFMPKVSLELTNSRKEEIVKACETLYETMSFKDITIKEIGNITSFTRTSIYNYFSTKEEIFLALLQKEYEYWIEDLNSIIDKNTELSRENLADCLAHSLEKRKNMLKLLAMNLYDIEENSRTEKLVEFKKVYGCSLAAVKKMVAKFCKDMNENNIKEFLFSFFPFVYGIYPYAVVTDKQRQAMNEAGVDFVYMSIYDIAFAGAKRLLGV